MDLILLVARAVIVISMIAFVAALFHAILADLNAITQQMETPPRIVGHLRLVEDESEQLEVDSVFPLRPSTLLGRAPTCDVVIPDSFASLEHALLTLRDGQWWLIDRGSRNGTHVNDIVVEGELILTSGDLIRIGRVTLRFETL